MKDKLIELIIACDKELHGIATHKSMCPSSSIEEIAEYMSKNISNDFFVAIVSEILEKLNDYVDVKGELASCTETEETFQKYCSMMASSRYRYSDVVIDFAKETVSINE